MKILIVEDDTDLNRIIVKKLRAEGHTVDGCFTGREAVDYLRSTRYDAAVMDIMMPELDGLEAVRELRQQGDATPVIFLTARDTVQDRVRGLDGGAIALESAGLTEGETSRIRVRLDREKGRRVYEVELRSGRTEYEFEIDAATGAVLERDADYEDD